MSMHVVFRVDASPAIGTGHLHRCLTLAATLRQRDVKLTFLCRALPEAVPATVHQVGTQVIVLPDGEDDASATARCLRAMTNRPAWLVVDHYGWSAEAERLCAPWADRVLVIDDLANRPHHADVLVDQNYFPDPVIRYQMLVQPDTRLLLGPAYALLRPEFSKHRKTLLGSKPVQTVLVSFGGSDPGNMTEQVLEALADWENRPFRLRVILGGMHPARSRVEALARRLPDCELLTNITDMAWQMATADLYLGGGGITTWERLCIGLPGIVIAIAENQEALSAALAEDGYQLYLGPAAQVGSSDIRDSLRFLIENPETRLGFARRGQQLVDGLGTGRVAETMHCLGVAVR